MSEPILTRKAALFFQGAFIALDDGARTFQSAAMSEISSACSVGSVLEFHQLRTKLSCPERLSLVAQERQIFPNRNFAL